MSREGIANGKAEAVLRCRHVDMFVFVGGRCRRVRRWLGRLGYEGSDESMALAMQERI